MLRSRLLRIGRRRQSVASGPTSGSITQNGITWTFDTEYQVGQFLNGDWYVIPNTPGAGVTVSSVSPAWDGAKNGSMLNPLPSGEQVAYQGLDSRASGYNSSFRQTFPVTIDPSSATKSLVSCIGRTSQSSGGAAQCLQYASILTVMASAPAANSFRPPWCGGGAKPVYALTDCNFSLLPGLAVPSGATVPTFTGANEVTGPYIDFGQYGQGGSEVHNDQQMQPYPADTSYNTADMMLAACTNDANAQTWAKRLVQLGIDLYETSKSNGRGWRAYGGFGMGRKVPIMFAGKLLGVSAMRDIGAPMRQVGAYEYYIFGEDGHSFYGKATASYPSGAPMFGRENYGFSYYHNHDLRDHVAPETYECGAFTNGEVSEVPRMPGTGSYPHVGAYRGVNVRAWMGHALAALILGLRTGFGNDAYFDLCDRCLAENWQASPFANRGFVEDMWNEYRADY